jgi:hypothetical protein
MPWLADGSRLAGLPNSLHSKEMYFGQALGLSPCPRSPVVAEMTLGISNSSLPQAEAQTEGRSDRQKISFRALRLGCAQAFGREEGKAGTPVRHD